MTRQDRLPIIFLTVVIVLDLGALYWSGCLMETIKILVLVMLGIGFALIITLGIDKLISWRS